MKVFQSLDKKNFLFYCYHHYNNPACIDVKEFEEDLERLKYIKKILKRYKNTGKISHRLVLNHIIILTNIFGVVPAMRIIFYKVDSEEYPQIKSFISYLGYDNDTIRNVLSKCDNIDLNKVLLDTYITKELNTI